MLTVWEQNFIANHRVARLATVDEAGRPHVVPIVYAFDGERLYTPIDAKPKRVGPHRLQRVRNIELKPQVGLIIDDYDEDWTRLAWVQIRGTAKIIETGPEHAAALALLQQKYPQYETMSLQDRPIIVINPGYVTGWRATEGLSP